MRRLWPLQRTHIIFTKALIFVGFCLKSRFSGRLHLFMLLAGMWCLTVAGEHCAGTASKTFLFLVTFGLTEILWFTFRQSYQFLVLLYCGTGASFCCGNSVENISAVSGGYGGLYGRLSGV